MCEVRPAVDLRSCGVRYCVGVSVEFIRWGSTYVGLIMLRVFGVLGAGSSGALLHSELKQQMC